MRNCTSEVRAKARTGMTPYPVFLNPAEIPLIVS
jgi:hypothetical protein